MDWRTAWVVAESDGTGETAEVIEFICPVCEAYGSLQDDSSGFRVSCNQCGAIVDEIADDRPEWSSRQETRMFSKDPARADAINPLMPHASMTTEIVPSTRLRYNQYKMIKLNRWSAMSPMERSLCVVFEKIETCCNRSHICSQVVYTTKVLFRRVYESNLKKQKDGGKREGLRGPKRDGLIAACLYMAFKTCDLYWAKARIAKVFSISVAEVRRGLAIFWDLLKGEPLPDKLVKITGCKQYINWFSVELKMSRRLCTFACRLYKMLKAEGIGTSKQPQSSAAGCIWSVCQELQPDIDIDRVVHVTGISKATIKDVERLMDGYDRIALVMIFTREVCELNEMVNETTIFKAQQVAKVLCSLESQLVTETMPKNLWMLAVYAVYFVMTINDAHYDPVSSCKLEPSKLLTLSKLIVPYRDAIISECLGGEIYRHVGDDDEQVPW